MATMAPERKCSCTWKECKILHDTIVRLAPPDHPWNSKKFRFQFAPKKSKNMTLKMFALRQAIFRHLPLEGDHLHNNYFIHAHHFPRCLLDWREKNNVTSFTKCMTLADTNEIAVNDVSFRTFGEYANSVQFYSQAFFAAPHGKEAEFRSLFLQSPIGSRQDVLKFINCLKSTNSLLG